MRGLPVTLAAGIGSLRLAAALHSYDFHLAEKEVEISPGVSRTKTVINGQFPGPLVRVPYNSDVQMNVFNELAGNSTTIHWHGLHQRGTPYSDGFPQQNQCPIPSNATMAYNFKAFPGGSTFWHAHFHEQSINGIHGPFIVEDEPGTWPFKYDEEKIILMTDAYDATSWQVEDRLIESLITGGTALTGDPVPDEGFLCIYDEETGKPSCSSTTDGRGFDLHFEKGKTYRLRLICSAGIAPFMFSIDGHEMQIASVDFTPTDGTAWVKGVPMMTGQRYDVIVRARDDVKDGEKFWVRAAIRGDCEIFVPVSLNTDVRGVLTYGETASTSAPQSTGWNITNECADLEYSTLKPATSLLSSVSSLAPLEEPALTMFLNFTFTSIVNNVSEILINGNSYNVSDAAYPTLFHIQEDPTWKPTTPGEQRNLLTIPDSLRNKQIRFVLRTELAPFGGGHPFHAHGRGFKVLAVGDGDITQEDLDNVTDEDVKNAITRDTVVVPRRGWVITQFEAINPGVWAFHCHIAWHVGNGMLGQIIELPQAIHDEIVIPQVLKDMCPSHQ